MKDANFDELKIKRLDRFQQTFNFFFEVHGGSSNTIKIAPLEIQLNYLGGFRQGIGSIHGPSQEYAGIWGWPFKVFLHKCVPVDKPNLIKSE